MANKRFLRQNSKLLKKLGHKWRKPRGRQSKMRERRGGKAPVVTIGYGTANKHVHPSGLMESLIFNAADLKNVSKESAVRIASAVGARKRIEIINEAKKMGLKLLNPTEIRVRTIVNAHTKKAEKKAAKKTPAKKEEKK